MKRLSALLFILLLAGPGATFVAAQELQPPAEQPVVYLCPLHPDVQAKLPGKCHKCSQTLVRSTGEDEGFYACPMHPEIQATKEAKCSKCGMLLLRVAAAETAEYQVKLETTPTAVKAGEKVRLRFSIHHPKKGEQIKEFNILHDMPFHLFVISQDLAAFDHIHPTQEPDGSFVIDTVLPQPGYYRIYCDFFPKGGTPQVIHHNLVTADFNGDLVGSLAELKPDQNLSKTVAGTRFELTFDPVEPIAGKHAILKYQLTDAKTGQPVKDLQPYLGAWGHTLILSEDATDYLHSHPTEMIPEEIDRTKLSGGPAVTFDTFFPQPGHYRIWSQFQRKGKVTTVSFTVYVSRLK